MLDKSKNPKNNKVSNPKFLIIPDLFTNLAVCPYRQLSKFCFIVNKAEKQNKSFLFSPLFIYLFHQQIIILKPLKVRLRREIAIIPPFFIRQGGSFSFLDQNKFKLKIYGVGYFFRVVTSSVLEIMIGCSHSFFYTFPPEVFFRLSGRKKRFLIVWSSNSVLLTNIIYAIRNLKSLDIYRNKGIRFVAEKLPLKVGKKKFV